MTLTETILARASGRDRVQPGDNIWVNADILLTHDVCGPGTIGVFHREFGRDARVWDRRKIVIIPDHYIFTADSLSNRNVDILRDFVREQGLPYFYDVIDDPNGHWHVRRRARPAQAPVRRAVRGRLPHGPPGKGSRPTRRGAVRHGLAHLHGGRVRGVRHRHRQHRRGFHPRHRQAAGEGARDDAIFTSTARCKSRRDGQGRDPARHRRDRLRRRDLPRHAVGRPRREQPGHGRPDDHHQHGHRGRRQERHLRGGPRRPSISSTPAAPPTARRPNYEPAVAGRDQKFVYDQAFDLSALEPTVAMHPNPGNRALAKTLGHIIARPGLRGQLHGRQDSRISWRSRRSSRAARSPSIPSVCPRRPTVVDDLHKIQWDGKSVWQWLEEALACC